MDGGTSCRSSTTMPLWRSQPSKTLGAQTLHTPASCMCERYQANSPDDRPQVCDTDFNPSWDIRHGWVVRP